MKYDKKITLALAPYKTLMLGVSEADSFAQCDEELKKEIARHPKIEELNKEDIKKAL